MSATGRDKSSGRFNLVRWFSISGFVAIAVLSIAAGSYFTRILTLHALANDANVMTEFVNGIVRIDMGTGVPATVVDVGDTYKIEAFFAQLSKVPGIIRANVYSTNQTILWSSDPRLLNQQFGPNEELEEALSGSPVSHLNRVDEHSKEEHVALPQTGNRFVEYYLPIWHSDSDTHTVAAIAEIYRVPFKLLSTLEQITLSVWVSAVLGGVFLFACLFWIVRRAAVIMAMQDANLSKTLRLATIGEMASTVAHSLRNPLSNIRSSAELARENDNCVDTNQALDQIMLESDMMESWVRRYLGLMSDNSSGSEPCSLRTVLDEAIEALSRHPSGRDVTFVRKEPEEDIKVRFNSVVLLQIVSGLLCNAIEASPADRKVEISVSRETQPQRVLLQIRDSGIGIKPEDLKKVFDPFFTTKRNGLGIGLALTHQILERHHGSIEIRSEQGRGTVVSVYFAAE